MPADTTTDLLPSEIDTIDKKDEAPKGRVASILSGLKRRPWLLGGAVLALVALAFVFNPFNAAKPEIVTASVARGDIEQTVLATGVLEPAKLISVGAQASGQVKKLYVELGDTVKAGDPIADIDSRNQINTVSNAQAGLSNVTAQRSAANADLTQAQLNYERQKRLYEQGASAKSDFEAAESQLANARANLAAASAQIRQANLTLNTAETNLGYTKIVAPMDGTIVAVVTEEGQTVNANQSAPTIVMLAQLDKMTVSAEISEADVEKVEAGQDVYFTTLGDSTKRHYAKLRTVAPAPESIESTSSTSSSTASAVYYNGLFDVDNADGKLKTGMTAQVYIVQASAKDALTIPSSALERRGREGYFAKVVKENGEIEQRAVKVGINTNVTAQITEGLSEGEKIVVAEVTADQKASRSQSQSSNPLAGGGSRRGMGGGGSRP
ncbi:MAG: efflux RND transporter periplasmic adaptor subunit [Hyphomonadaceae bacterium]|nr:efflux RND transporter periplasmic adaptor subunit [Hyphomonadaceae bacterium]